MAFQGTLNEWILINIFEFFLLVYFGYSNYYIPDSQKAKARKRKGKQNTDDNKCTIMSSLHLGLPAYLLFATLAIVLSWVYFFVYIVQIAFDAFETGIVAGIVWAAILLVLLLSSTFFLAIAPFAGESQAELRAKNYYKKKYNVIVLDPREERIVSD